MTSRGARIKPNGQPAPGPLGNAPGVITPKTEPNLSGSDSAPPTKTETPEEQGLLHKAGELLEKGEIKALNDAKDWVQGGVDAGVQAMGGGAIAQGAGVVIKGAVDIFFPTNVIDIVPGGKILSGGKKAVKLGEKVLKNSAEQVAEKAAKDAAEKAAKEAAEKRAKDAGRPSTKGANGSNGGYGKRAARRPRHKCELMKYKDMICDGEKHHVLPDFMMRTGSAKHKFDPSTRIPGTPDYDNAPAICLSKEEHKGLHKTADAKIAAAGQGQNGAITMGQAKQINSEEAAKKSGCNPKNIKKQLNRLVKAPDDKLLRAVKDARKVTDELNSVLRPDIYK